MGGPSVELRIDQAEWAINTDDYRGAISSNPAPGSECDGTFIIFGDWPSDHKQAR